VGAEPLVVVLADPGGSAGVSVSDLKQGPGHYPDTAMPGRQRRYYTV